MFGFGVKTRKNSMDSTGSIGSPGSLGSPAATDSPKLEVGEIDTRAPFQSVKAAVSLFGPTLSPGRISKNKKSEEREALDKETEHVLLMRELNKYKDIITNAENTKSDALRDLDKANRTMTKLTTKLDALSESKQSAIKGAEEAKKRAKELENAKSLKKTLSNVAWKEDVDNERENYKNTCTELDVVKQELVNLRQDFDAALEKKLAAFQEAADAQHVTSFNQDRITELLKEIATLRETLSEVQHASCQAQEEREKLEAEKEVRLELRRKTKEEMESKTKSLMEEESDPQLSGNLEVKLEETNETIKVLEEQLKGVRDLDVEALKATKKELMNTKKDLEQVLKEETSFQKVVDSLKLELDGIRRNITELEKKIKAESLAESFKGDAYDDTQLKLQELSREVEHAKRDAEKIERQSEALKKEAETSRMATKEYEEKLQVVLKEAEEAKAAENVAESQIRSLSLGGDNANATDSKPKSKISLSDEDHQSFYKRIEEAKSGANMKVATAMTQAESVNAKEQEARAILETSLKELEEIEAATNDAVKQSEMAEAAKKAVECELRKWRMKEGKNVVGESTEL